MNNFVRNRLDDICVPLSVENPCLKAHNGTENVKNMFAKSRYVKQN